MSQKIRVGIIFGGRSAEHEVSLQSAKNVIDAIDKKKYDVVMIGIGKDGKWYLNESSQYLLNESDPKLIKLNNEASTELAVVPGQALDPIQNLSDHKNNRLDVVFPVLHGTYGEDGTIQGLLKLLDVPFVGPGVLGSAVAMDKDVAKRLMRDAGIPTPKFLIFSAGGARLPLRGTSGQGSAFGGKDAPDFEKVSKELGSPVFIKPANLGSSVGISKAKTKEEFDTAVKHAFEFDNKILVEQFIAGREIECAVLGNDSPVASVPGEVIPKGHEFYSYEAKYIDEAGAELKIPAELEPDQAALAQILAIKTFKALGLFGMARVDFFLDDQGQFFVNEVNTIPGFTKISMYPKLWEATGLSYSALIDTLIQLALEQHKKEKRLKTSY